MGVSLNYFYCCGKLKTVSFKTRTLGKKECKKRVGKKCCENKTVTVKLKLDQKETQNPDVRFNHIDEFVLTDYNIFTPSISYSTAKTFALYSNPPPLNFLSRNILYCTFLI